jgi:hypothetical protein
MVAVLVIPQRLNAPQQSRRVPATGAEKSLFWFFLTKGKGRPLFVVACYHISLAHCGPRDPRRTYGDPNNLGLPPEPP